MYILLCFKIVIAVLQNYLMETDKFLETHLYLYNEVSSERRRLEAECARYRHLLKPWHFSPVAFRGEAPKESEGETKGAVEAVGVDQHEEKELKLISNILARAEKTRNKHSQLTKEERNENACQERRDKVAGGDQQSLPKTDSRNSSSMSSQVGVISQSKLNQIVKKNICANQSKKPTTKTSVHSKAPFKTEPDKVPLRRGSAQKKPVSARASGTVSQKGCSDQRASSSGRVGVMVARHRTPSGGRVHQVATEEKGDHPVLNECLAEKGGMVSEVGAYSCSRTEVYSCDITNKAMFQSRDTANRAENQHSGTTDNVELHSSDTTNRAENQHSGTTKNVELHSSDTTNRSLTSDQSIMPNGQARSSQKFDLLKDGSKLVIPSKLKRMFSHNCHLRKKLGTRKLTVKVDTASQRESFLEKLNQQVDIDEKVQLGEAVNGQIHLHRNLQSELNDLELNQLSAGLSGRDILRKKMILEMILMMYREAGTKVVLLAQGMVNNDPDICDQMVDMPAQLGYRCSSALSWDPGAADEGFDYSKETDLLRYIKLQHSIRLLHIHKTIVSEVLDVVLPELEQTASETPHSVVPLYRAVYALLSYPASHLPTVVMDTTEES